MKEKYSYKLRPAYNSSELLIEFVKTGDADVLLNELIALLSDNGFYLESISDVWMNDEIWVHLASPNGKIMITKSIWDMMFILSNENQKDIKIIDEILIKIGIFKKEPVDFSEYK